MLIVTIAWVSLSALAENPSRGTPSMRINKNIPPVKRSAEPFLIMEEMISVAKVRALGWAVINPGHPTEPLNKVIDRYKGKKTVKGVRIHMCAGPDQRKTLPAILPIADQIAIWAFHLTSTKGPTSDDAIWPMFNNPLINRIREIRSLTAGTILFAIINYSDVRRHWGVKSNQALAWEEIRWLVYAVIGANYQGVLWEYSNPPQLYNRQIAQLERRIKAYASELGRASLVKWIKSCDNTRVSAIASEKKLFIVLLNPDYMVFGPDGRTILSPIEPKKPEGEILIKPPNTCIIESGTYLNGRPLEFVPCEEGIRVKYRFRGGGEILVFDLEWNSKGHTKKYASEADVSAVKGEHDESDEAKQD